MLIKRLGYYTNSYERSRFSRSRPASRIVRGPFERIEGILSRKKGLLRVVLSINLIVRFASVEIELTDFEQIR